MQGETISFQLLSVFQSPCAVLLPRSSKVVLQTGTLTRENVKTMFQEFGLQSTADRLRQLELGHRGLILPPPPP